MQKLHTFGLLNNSFRPVEEIRILRTYLRQRENMVAATSTCVQHMQEALTQINLQLANVISDISGATGMAILARLSLVNEILTNWPAASMVESARPSSRSPQNLEGDWRDELLFVLQQSLELYDTCTGKIAEGDQRIEAHLRTMQSKPGAPPQPLPETAQPHKLGARFNLRDYLHRIVGVDLTKINGLDVQTVQIIISEVGVDMSRWNTEKSFASWLGLYPDNWVSGGKS